MPRSDWSRLTRLSTSLAGLGPLILLPFHLLKQWFSRSDEAAEDALHDVQGYRALAGIDLRATRIPDATTVLEHRQLPEALGLATGFLATINAVLQAKGILRAGERRSMPPMSPLPTQRRAEGGRAIRSCTRRERGAGAHSK